MRPAALFALLLAVAAAPPPAREAKPDARIEWTVGHYPRTTRLRVGRVQLVLVPMWESRENDVVGLRLTILDPGRAPVTFDGERPGGAFTSIVTVGRWDSAGDRYVLLESFTGGAHCCDHLQLAVPEPGRFRTVDLGRCDGEKLREPPADLDGDGRVDFVVGDDSFLYRFGSYAESFAPAKILNVVGGRVTDVSAKPGFRSLFRREMRLARSGCVQAGNASNATCAGYAATAARAGLFNRAWAEILRVYDRADDSYPDGCRVARDRKGDCPPSQVRYRSYPQSLRAFLRSRGYIAR
jgi:hypothetical protein